MTLVKPHSARNPAAEYATYDELVLALLIRDTNPIGEPLEPQTLDFLRSLYKRCRPDMAGSPSWQN